jgi:hypothetical protein
LLRDHLRNLRDSGALGTSTSHVKEAAENGEQKTSE